MTINGRTLSSVSSDMSGISTTESAFRTGLVDLLTEASSYGKLPGGVFSNMQVFTSSGTWTKPADTDIRYYTVIAIGGGGGPAYQANGGGGGGGGSLIVVVAASDLSSTEGIIVGAGGAANTNGGSSGITGKILATGGYTGSGSSGGSGGTTSFGITPLASVSSVGGAGGNYNAGGSVGTTTGASRWAPGGGGGLNNYNTYNAGGAGGLFSFWGITPGAGNSGGYGAGGRLYGWDGCNWSVTNGGPGFVMIVG